MRINVFKTIFFIFILILFLNSCSDSRYILDGFFTEEELEKYEVLDLPVMDQKHLYDKAGGFLSESVYSVGSIEDFHNYANQVFEYLNNKNYAYLGTIGKLRTSVGLVPLADSYYYQEANTLADFYQEEDSAYYFVYTNNENIVTNDYDEEFLSDEHILVIEYGSSKINNYDEKGSNFNYDYHVSFFLFSAITICPDIVMENFKYEFTQQYYVTDLEYLEGNTEEITSIINAKLLEDSAPFEIGIKEFLKLKTYITNNYFVAIRFNTQEDAKKYYEFYLKHEEDESYWIAIKNDIVIITDDSWCEASLSISTDYADLEFIHK